MVQSGALFVSESPWLHVFAAKVTVNSMSPTGSNFRSSAPPSLRSAGPWPCRMRTRVSDPSGPRRAPAECGLGSSDLNHDRRSHAYAGVGTGVGGPGAIILKTAVRRGHRRDDHRTFCGRLPLYHLMTSPDLGLT